MLPGRTDHHCEYDGTCTSLDRLVLSDIAGPTAVGMVRRMEYQQRHAPPAPWFGQATADASALLGTSLQFLDRGAQDQLHGVVDEHESALPEAGAGGAGVDRANERLIVQRRLFLKTRHGPR